jgi:hypothetical protein
MKHHGRRSSTLLKSHLHRLYYQVGIGARRKGPAKDQARKQVQNRSEIMPTPFRPHERDFTAPNAIGRLNVELAVEAIGNVDMLYGGLFIRMIPRLLSDQTKFGHQLSDLEASNRRTFLAHHARDAAAARRTANVDEPLTSRAR